MAKQVRTGRWTAQIDGDFVVFLIGARFNSKWQAFRAIGDLGGRRGMRHMLDHLTEHPRKGLLGYEMAGFTVIQRPSAARDAALPCPDPVIRSARAGSTIPSTPGSARTRRQASWRDTATAAAVGGNREARPLTRVIQSAVDN
jgi:hypothetical protein